VGIPGAAVVGASVDLGIGEIDDTAISPNQDYFIAIPSLDKAAVLATLGPTHTPPKTISALGLRVGRVTLSPSGSAAALYDSEDARLQIIVGLPNNATTVREIDLGDLSEKLASFALSDDGSLVLGTISAGEYSGLYAWSEDQPKRWIASSLPSSLIFLHRSQDAVAADAMTGNVSLIRAFGSGAYLTVTPMTLGQYFIGEPSLLALSEDNRFLIIASGESGVVLRVPLIEDSDPSNVSVIKCQCKPTQLERFGSRALFRVTEVSSDPIWLLDSGQDQPSMLSVPWRADVRALFLKAKRW
jgi:hypothetical protein